MILPYYTPKSTFDRYIVAKMEKKRILHFAHGNGFPAGTYGKLLGLLRLEYDVIAIEKLGHNPSYPIDENWAGLVEELINYVEKNAREPVIGVGHSMGSLLTFLAAYHRPDLFRLIIMLDPPVLYGPAAFFFLVSKKLNLLHRKGLIAHSMKRPTEWSSSSEAADYFKRNPPFNRFDPECLRDYMHYGIITSETGAKLSFDVNLEIHIFKTTPHNLNCLRKRLLVPGTMVLGEYTNMPAGYMVSRFAKRQGLLLERFKEGSHVFPFEYPLRTASLIKETIDRLDR